MMRGLVVLLGAALALVAVACSGVSKSDLDALQAEVQRKADAAAMTQIANTAQKDVTAQKQELATLQQQVQTRPDLDAVTKLVDGRFAKVDRKLALWDIQAGTADRMLEFTQSMNLMWFAAQAGNWDFAGFSVMEMGAQADALLVTHPGRTESLTKWAEPNLKALDVAVKAKDKAAFEKAYDETVAGCNACHAENKAGGYELKSIKVVRPTTPLFPNLDYKGQ